ncbi:MAG: amino acid racemase [Nanoarchaeota archaeon]|nr:amino acid racemase [Nanoarchaeota archaeon]
MKIRMVVVGGNLRIGVLGGIGPEATGEYYLKLIKGLQQTGLIKNNSDFPQIIVNSIPAPELVGEISAEQLKPYKTGIRELDKYNVDVIVIVCNTLYLYYDELQSEVKTHIMDLRQEVKKRLIDKDIKRTIVLGTPSTIRKGLYKFDGIEYVNVSDQDIDQLSTSIFSYNKGKNKLLQKQLVERIARKYVDSGAEIIIIGCTELAVMLKDVNIPKIDTIDVLVEGTIEFIEEFGSKK